MAQLKPNPKLLSAALTRFCCFAKSPFRLFLHTIRQYLRATFGAQLCTTHHSNTPPQCAWMPNKKPNPLVPPATAAGNFEETRAPGRVSWLSAPCWMPIAWFGLLEELCVLGCLSTLGAHFTRAAAKHREGGLCTASPA